MARLLPITSDIHELIAKWELRVKWFEEAGEDGRAFEMKKMVNELCDIMGLEKPYYRE
jgi:hypothetical protein